MEMNYDMEMDRHKFLDKAEPENEPAGVCSFSWGKRELRIFGEQMTLHVNGISHDMTSVLDALRDIGARPEKTSPARWISLLRGKPTNLPGCGRPLMIVKAPSGYTVRCLETTSCKDDKSLQMDLQ